MTKIRLFLFANNVVSSNVMADAEHLKKIPKEKIADFMKWLVRFRTHMEVYTPDQWCKFAEMFGFKSIEELYGAQRFAGRLLAQGCALDRSELVADLNALGLEQEKIGLIVDQLETAWDEIDDYLKQAKAEAIPVLTSLRWRVDIRHASGNYLKKPEVIVLLRIGTHDGVQRDQIYIELDKDDLSWLDTVIGKVKREFLKAEERLNQ
jgi:hypothetical protein